MFILNVLAFPLVVGTVIISHEYGHFIVARLFGVPVSSFNFGIGPKLISGTWGATEYCVRAFPIGGYVKIGSGEDDEVDHLRQQPAYVQALISIAGILMNVIVALVVLTASFAIGTVGDSGDSVIEKVAAGSPAQKAGIQPQSTIVSARVGSQLVNGTDPERLVALIVQSDGAPITFVTAIGSATHTVVLVPKETTRAGVRTYDTGILMSYMPKRRPLSIGRSLSLATQTLEEYSEDLAKVMPQALYNTISLSNAPEKFSGPVGIAHASVHASQHGLTELLQLIMMISMGLAFLNILPIPPLDGFHFLVRIPVEWMRGRPLPDATVGVLQFVGVIAMVLLIATATWSDIAALF
jgi:regulator of sigma E protease